MTISSCLNVSQSSGLPRVRRVSHLFQSRRTIFLSPHGKETAALSAHLLDVAKGGLVLGIRIGEPRTFARPGIERVSSGHKRPICGAARIPGRARPPGLLQSSSQPTH